MNFLTEDELIELTKAKQPQKQGQILDENGIYYIRRADKTIITTWHHVNHPHESSAKPESNGIDLSKVYADENSCHGSVPLMTYLDDKFDSYVYEFDKIKEGIKVYRYREGPPSPGCYFLFDGDKCVYVGKATNIAARLNAHFVDPLKGFDGYAYIETPCAHVAEYVEGYYMKLISPPLNKRIPMLCDAARKLLRLEACYP